MGHCSFQQLYLPLTFEENVEEVAGLLKECSKSTTMIVFTYISYSYSETLTYCKKNGFKSRFKCARPNIKIFLLNPIRDAKIF